MKNCVSVATAFVATSALLVGCGGGGADVATSTPTSPVGATQVAAPIVATTAAPVAVVAAEPASAQAVVPAPAAITAAPVNSTVTVTVSAATQPAVTSSAASPATASPSLASLVSTLVSVPEYKASRNPSAAVATDPVPNAAALATLAAANRRMSVTQLSSQLSSSGAGNPVVIPPLTYAVLRTLTAAASGDTLAQLKNSGFDTAPMQYVAALQTNRVTSQLWSDRARRFTPAFLTATDTLGPWPRLAKWSAFETGFADGSFATDAGLISGLAQADPNLTVTGLPPTKNLRLLAANSVAEKASWAAVTPFDGIFDGGQNKHDLLQMPMVKVTAGVMRFAGTDFTADAMPMAGGLQLISLRPNSGTLAAYSSSRLEAALAEAQQGLLAVGATPVAGEMILPKVDISLNLEPRAPLARAGVSLPFDEVNANFRAMDGLGGVYAIPFFSRANLRVGSDGLTVNAADATAFTFSPLNIFGPGSAGFVFGNSAPSFINFDLFTCTWPTPDLRSFFLVVLDGQGSVMSIAAIQAPPGTEVLPSRTAYNPWSANLAYWVFPGDMKGQYPSLIVSAAGQPAAVDVVSQAGPFGFVSASGAYSHQTCVK